MTGKRIRLLLSAHDFGGGLGIGRIAEAAASDHRFKIDLVADGPAAELFRKRGLAVTTVDAGRAENKASASQLIALARDVLAKLNPDVVLVALSGPEAGLDEALLAAVTPPVPTFALQDYWGDVNMTLGCAAATYFVVDSFAAELTRARCGSEAVVVGSVKHADYGQRNAFRERQAARARLGIEPERSLVGFFGQPLWSVAGYAETIASFAAAIARQAPQAIAVYRPHPTEKQADLQRIHELSGAARNWRIDGCGDVEHMLSAADLAASVCSSAGFDQINMSRFSDKPLGSVLYLLHDDRLRQWVRERTTIDYLPPAREGLALQTLALYELDARVTQALDPHVRTTLWQRARQVVPDPALAPLRVLDHIERAVLKRLLASKS